jgi:uncharacterized protein involved in exopolysaccharide biosynthesis
MPNAPPPWRTIARHKWLVLVTTAVFTAAAAVAAYFQPDVWEASVKVWVRDQSVGLTKASDFAAERSNRLRTLLVNLREVVYSREVLEQTLLQSSGRPSGTSASPRELTPFLDDLDLAKLRDSIGIDTPKGTEFGSAEMFYVRVRDRDRQRALRLVTALFDQLRARFQQLGLEQADDLLRKTNEQVAASQKQLGDAQSKFDQFVKQVGPNLPDLVVMSGGLSIDSELRRAIQRVRELLTPARAELEQRQALLRTVQGVDTESGSFAIPASFLRDHTSLEQTRQAVVQAQIEFERQQAEITPENPRWKVQQERVANLQNEFRREWSRARVALEQEVSAQKSKVDYLSRELDTQTAQLTRLTERYVEYDGLRAEVKQRQDALAEAERRRSEALHARATAAQDVLLSVVDKARISAKPVNLRRGAMLGMGAALGLLTGLGLAFLVPSWDRTIPQGPGKAGWPGGVAVLATLPRVRAPFHQTN